MARWSPVPREGRRSRRWPAACSTARRRSPRPRKKGSGKIIGPRSMPPLKSMPARVEGEEDQGHRETRTFRPRLNGEAAEREDREDRAYLLVFQDDSSAIFHLPEEGTIVIGRSSEADLHLQDA